MASDSETPEPGVAPKKLSAAEIARDWGTSRAYVGAKIKEGCPNTSLQAAREWREAHSKYGVGYRSKGAPAPERSAEKPRPADFVQVSGELASLEASLAAAVTVEEEALGLVKMAMREGKPSALESRLRSYNVACKNRSEREAAVREELERRGNLVSMEAAKALFARAWQVVIPKLRAMGTRLGVQCNQDDPVLAANTIDAEVISILAEGQKAYAA